MHTATRDRRQTNTTGSPKLSLASRTAEPSVDQETILLRRAQAALLEAETLLRKNAIDEKMVEEWTAKLAQLGELVRAIRQRNVAAAS